MIFSKKLFYVWKKPLNN
jgi:glycerol kinase